MAEETLKIFSFRRAGKERAGLCVGSQLYDLSWLLCEWPGTEDLELPDFPTVLHLIERGCFGREWLRELWRFACDGSLAGSARLQEPVEFLPPITRPQKILCLGRNYAAHAQETGASVPEEPIFFAKAPSSLIGHEQPIRLPALSKRVDHEAELAFVIGKRAKGVPAEKAWDYVAGYTIVNDVTARDLQKADIDKARPWFRSKSFDTFCPCGPWIVPREEIPNPHSLNIELRVNREVRQKANTADMIFKIPELVEYLSAHLTLEPGDIISTGTPEGISPLRPGDVVEVEIERIGVLRNPVAAESGPTAEAQPASHPKELG
jgi:2-keto-4-pentenoate hydratase/2-oxohepta-3-ene-1,7-dioic acid hydratase in catechol pathway